MAVILLLGIALSLAVPSLTAALEIIKLKDDANKMAQILRLARQKAVTCEQEIGVGFYSNGNKYKVYNYSTHLWEATHLLHEGNIIVGTTTFKTYVADKPGCIFKPSGAPVRGGTVTIRNKNNELLYVIVNPVAGRVRISDEHPENW